MLHVRRIADSTELPALRDDWNRLCGDNPFCRFEWNHGWWRNYHEDGELYVLEVREEGRLIGLAPWYLRRHSTQGRILAFLASGEVCSDYQTIFCEPGREDEVAAALADWLSDVRGSLTEWVTREDQDRWDLMEWECVPLDDKPLRELARQLKLRGAAVYQRPSDACWRIDLSSGSEVFEARLSKSHRKQVRRSIKNFLETGRARFHTVRTSDELETGREILIRLHQRRWNDLGERGVFASPRFTNFHTEMMAELLRLGLLRLYWLELDGEPAAAEYALAGEQTIFCYQSGVAPHLLKLEPGRISKAAMILAALEEGKTALDLLRGNEPYKAHWRADEIACAEIRIVARRPVARLRNQMWLTGSRVKRMLKRSKPPTEQLPHSRDWQKLAGAIDWPVATLTAPHAHTLD